MPSNHWLKVNEAAEVILKTQQKEHSKVNEINYEKLKIQKYIVDKWMVELLVAARSSTIRGFRTLCPRA